MNRRQVTTAVAIGGVSVALGRAVAWRPAMAGGWVSLELLNPLRVAVVQVPVVIDAQILQHGVTPNPDFDAAIRFIHDESGTEETLGLTLLSRAHALARGEHVFAEPGRWRMVTAGMGPEIELGTVDVVDPDDDDVISALSSGPELAASCGDVASGPAVETEILDSAFAEPRLEVAAGTTVTWVNTSPIPHQIVFDDGTIAGSTMLREADHFSATFAEAGDYAYHCAPHPFMTGVVAVASV